MKDATMTSTACGVWVALARVTRRGFGPAGIAYSVDAMKEQRSRTMPVEPTAPGTGRRCEGQEPPDDGSGGTAVWIFIAAFAALCAAALIIANHYHGA